MKKLLGLISLITALFAAHSTQAQTNPPVISGPAADAWPFITGPGATNWFVVPFGIYSPQSKDFGGGLALGYKLSDFVAPVMRLDYFRGGYYMPSAAFQLQVPVKLFNRILVTPFTFAGVATTVAGGGSDNGAAIGIYGIGGAVQLSSKFDLVADYELWNGGPFKSSNQVRLGVLWKF